MQLNLQNTQTTGIQVDLRYQLIGKAHTVDLIPVIALLKQLASTGNLRAAAAHAGYSYRKAWNLLKDTELYLGQPLVIMQRGRGTQLSTAGQRLLVVVSDAEQKLRTTLAELGHKAAHALQPDPDVTSPLRMMASDSARLSDLRGQLSLCSAQIQTTGSTQALQSYADKQCEIAGFHIPVGSLGRRLLPHYRSYLDTHEDGLLLLEQREQGLISHSARPVQTLADCARDSLRFVNRQAGSGTRVLLDWLLREQGIAMSDLKGYEHEEHTHLAVASLIAAGEADVGPGIGSVARRLHLHFAPLIQEYYVLVLPKCRIDSSRYQCLLRALWPDEAMPLLDVQQFVELLQDGSADPA